MRYALSLVVGLLLAQKNFEGTVAYTTRFEGEMAKQLADMLRESMPERMVFQYKGDKVRMDMGEAILITDYGQKKAFILKSSMQTYMEQALEEDEKKDAKSQPQVKKTNEKAKILGYTAEKYEATVESEQGPVKVEVWTTPQIQLSSQEKNPLAQGVKVPGFPLKIVSSVPNVDLRIVFLATELRQEKLADTLFQIPAGYVKEDVSSSESD
jgi:hypothetical protein